MFSMTSTSNFLRLNEILHLTHALTCIKSQRSFPRHYLHVPLGRSKLPRHRAMHVGREIYTDDFAPFEWLDCGGHRLVGALGGAAEACHLLRVACGGGGGGGGGEGGGGGGGGVESECMGRGVLAAHIPDAASTLTLLPQRAKQQVSAGKQTFFNQFGTANYMASQEK